MELIFFKAEGIVRKDTAILMQMQPPGNLISLSRNYENPLEHFCLL